MQMVDAKQYLGVENGSPVDYRCEMDKYAENQALICALDERNFDQKGKGEPNESDEAGKEGEFKDFGKKCSRPSSLGERRGRS